MCGIPMTPPADMGAADEKTIERALAHAGANLENQNTELIGAFARSMIAAKFEDFIWRDANGGVCSNCKTGVGSAEMWTCRHKEYMRCPTCGKLVQVRDLRYGRKKLKQEFYAVEWRKSALEKDALVMIGFCCGQDMSGPEPQDAEKLVVPVLIDVFRYGKSAKRFQRAVWDYPEWKPGAAKWHLKRDVRPIGQNYFGKVVDIVKSDANFRATLAGTPFASGVQAIETARAKHGGWCSADSSEVVSAIARRPWLEYLAKAGFWLIARECIWAVPKGLLNERGGNIREILKLTKDRYAELKGKRADISEGTLRLLHMADDASVKVKLEEAQKIATVYGAQNVKEVLKLYGQMDRRLIRFAVRGSRSEWGFLRDYLQAAREIGADLSDPEARLPHNLHEAHDRMIMMRNELRYQKRRADQEKRCDGLQDKLDKRLPELERKYSFEYNGLILRPARKLIELIDEGNVLGHCVGGYVERYAGGGTDILFLRPADKPDIPWRTIEFSPVTGRMVQDRGYKNDRAAGNRDAGTLTPELKTQLAEFWAAFEAHRA